MESVSVASKGVGDSCCKILSENTLARRERGRFFRQTNLATGFAEIPLYPEREVKKYPL